MKETKTTLCVAGNELHAGSPHIAHPLALAWVRVRSKVLAGRVRRLTTKRGVSATASD